MGLSTARAALQVAWLLAAPARGRPRRRRRRGARQERLDRLQPARQPVRGGRRVAPLRRPLPARAGVPRAWSRPAPPRRRPSCTTCRGLVARRSCPHAQALLRRRRARRRAARRARARAAGHAQAPGPRARDIRDNAHALALGKVALALAPPEVVERYVQRRAAPLHAAHDHRPRRACAPSSRGPPRAATRSTARSSTTTSAASPRRSSTPRALPRGDRDLDDAPGLRRGARDARADGRRVAGAASRVARDRRRASRSACASRPFQPSAETRASS